MVVDVGLSEVLLLRVLVSFVRVGDRRMVVLVSVRGHEVGDLLLRPVVVRRVDVLVVVQRGLVIVGFRHGLPPLPEETRPSDHPSLVLEQLATVVHRSLSRGSATSDRG
jgi:hypothetical protein